MSDSKDRSGAPPTTTFDEAWDALPEGKAADAEPDTPEGTGATKAWTEEVRAARKHDGDGDEPEPEPEPSRTDATKAWTEEVRGARKHDGPAPDDADEMDRLMRAELQGAAPSDEDDIPPSASASALEFSALELPGVPKAKPDHAVMEAIMGGSSDAREDEPDEPEPPPPIVLHPDRAVEAQPSVVEDAEPAPRAKRKKKKNRTPLIVGGAVAAGIALWFGREPPPPAPKKTLDPAAVVAPAGQDEAKPSGPQTPRMPSADGPESESESGSGSEPNVERPQSPTPDPNRDPREPPPGTPPEIAAVFKKLPVSPADRAPVGGVGATGIHIDDVAMGSEYARSRCSGNSGSFSVSNDDRANVCIRVVHLRQKEELSIVWQKLEGNARRGKIVVKPLHAYRTRAYLKLRSEYVGDWVVSVYSDDGVELAQLPFSVVP